jgi:cell division septum initiation protein DivIVA
MLAEANFFVAGQRLDVKASAPMACLDESLEYLIKNTFTKMSYLKRVNENPQKELQAILRSNDIGQQTLALTLEEGNPQAIAEVRSYLELATKASHPVVLYDMIERYEQRPYGWPADEVLILVARLLILQEVQLVMDAAPLSLDRVYENVGKSAKQRKITLVRRRTVPVGELQKSRNLGKQVFAEMGPDGEDALFDFLMKKLRTCERNLGQHKTLADTGNYPGQDEINDGLTLCKALLACDESYKFIERFNERKDDLLDFCDQYNDLEHFYDHQRHTWEKLRSARDRFQLNRMELERNESAGPALNRIREILSAPNPYGIIKEAEGLVTTVDGINNTLIADCRAEALKVLDALQAQVEQEVGSATGDDSLKISCASPLDALRRQIERQESVAHITQAEQQAQQAFDDALTKIEAWVVKQQPKPTDDGTTTTDPPKPTIKPRKVIEPAKLTGKPYLETRDEVDEFLETLKKELYEVIEQNRIQIR